MFPAAQTWVTVKRAGGGVSVFPLRWIYDGRLVQEVDIYPEHPRLIRLAAAEGAQLRIGDEQIETITGGECYVSIEVRSGKVAARSPFQLIARQGGSGWQLQEAERPLEWKRRYILWGLWRRLTERPLIGLAGRAQSLSRQLHRFADKLARAEQAVQEQIMQGHLRGRITDIVPNHAVPLAASRKFDAKYRAPIRLLIDDIRQVGIEIPNDLLPPFVAGSRQLTYIAAELQYYAAKADELKRTTR